MKKSDAIDILYKSALLYEQNLKNKNLLIVYGDINSPKAIETKATDDNFLHLTGIININSTVTPAKFYKNILDKKVSEHDFEFKKDGTTEMKLSVLPYLMEITKQGKMLGVYNYKRPLLKTDKLIGNITASLGLLKTGRFYSPNTILKGDIRDDIEKSERVLSILSKKVGEKKYNTIESVAKKIDIHTLLPKIARTIDIDDSLLCNTRDTSYANNITATVSLTETKIISNSTMKCEKELNNNVKKKSRFCKADLKSEKYAPRSQKKDRSVNRNRNDLEH